VVSRWLPPSHTIQRGLIAGLACLLLLVVPALVWRSQTRLTAAVRALQNGDCPTATQAALDSEAALGVRPEPFEVTGYCEAAHGRMPLALEAVRNAIERDPDNWELRYDRALFLALAGRDPRAAVRKAAHLAPSNPDVSAAARAFATSDRRKWRAYAIRAPLPIPARPRP
jgi:hypothetical protein